MRIKNTFIALILCVMLSIPFWEGWGGACFAQGSWTQKTDFGGGVRFRAVGFSIGTKGYIGTGYKATQSISDDFWEYDPITNIWTQKANVPGGGRGLAVGFSIGNKGYIGTGYDNSFSFYKDFYEYNSALNTWTQKANFGGGGRWEAVGFSIGSKGYIGTGFGSFNYKQDFWEYDPATDKWTQKADFGGGLRRCAVGFSIGTKGYIGTGYNPTTKQDFWEYDPTSDKWTQKADFGGGLRYRAVGFSLGNKGYLGTGSEDQSGLSCKQDFWEYDPAADKWTQRENFGGTAREYAVGFSIKTLCNDKGYIGTGWNGSFTSPNYFKDFWEYAPSSSTSSPVTVNAGKDTIICKGNSVTLTATGATSGYSWNTGNPADTNASVKVTPSVSTNYIVSVSNGSCSSTDTVKVTVASFAVSVSCNTTVCLGDSAAFVAMGGVKYIWSTGATTASVKIKPTKDTLYKVIVSDSGMCPDTTVSVAVTVNPSYKAITKTVSICAGKSYFAGGKNQTLSGTYYDSLLTVKNCDILQSVIIYVFI